MADKHIPNDEYVDDKDCGDQSLHTDHFWVLIDGIVVTTNVINDKDEVWYCYGR